MCYFFNATRYEFIHARSSFHFGFSSIGFALQFFHFVFVFGDLLFNPNDAAVNLIKLILIMLTLFSHSDEFPFHACHSFIIFLLSFCKQRSTRDNNKLIIGYLKRWIFHEIGFNSKRKKTFHCLDNFFHFLLDRHCWVLNMIRKHSTTKVNQLLWVKAKGIIKWSRKMLKISAL